MADQVNFPKVRAAAFPLNTIGFTSEPVGQYTKELDAAKSLPELRAFAERWHSLASDAEQIINQMSEGDFTEFRAGLAKERKGRFAGDAFMERYGNIPMPDVLFAVSGTAAQYVVPWGLAYIRMRDVGRVTERDGCAVLAVSEPSQENATVK